METRSGRRKWLVYAGPPANGIQELQPLDPVGVPEPDKAVYVEFDRAGIVHCRLCEARGFGHL